MGKRANRKQLTTTEQVLRWTGFGSIALAVVLAIARFPGTQWLAPLALLAGVACLVAVAVVSYQQGRAEAD